MFYFDSKVLNQFADECVQQIEEDTIEYFKLHLAYHKHHFGYGLFLRNKFSSRVEVSSDFERDHLSSEIYVYILAKLFPELGNDFEKISSLIDTSLFSEVCAHYYIKNGYMPFKEFPIKNYNFIDFNDDNEDFDKAFNEWHIKYEQNLNDYILSIADSLWRYDFFRKKAINVGLDSNIVDKSYEVCKSILLEKNIFIPLEIAYYADEKLLTASIENIISNHMQFFFKEHSDDIEILPEYVFYNRNFVKSAVSSNGYSLRYAAEFKDDYEIVRIAVQDSPEAIEYASHTLKRNKDIIKTAIKNSKYCLIFNTACMKKYNDDDSLVKLALKANGANICYASKRIRDNYEMAKFALMHQRDIYPSSAYKSLSARLRDDKTLAMIELKREQPCVDAFSKRLKNDDEIAELLYRRKRTRWLMYHMSKKLQKKYKCNQ